jgi:hypothetical protein
VQVYAVASLFHIFRILCLSCYRFVMRALDVCYSKRLYCMLLIPLVTHCISLKLGALSLNAQHLCCVHHNSNHSIDANMHKAQSNKDAESFITCLIIICSLDANCVHYHYTLESRFINQTAISRLDTPCFTC